MYVLEIGSRTRDARNPSSTEIVFRYMYLGSLVVGCKFEFKVKVTMYMDKALTLNSVEP